MLFLLQYIYIYTLKCRLNIQFIYIINLIEHLQEDRKRDPRLDRYRLIYIKLVALLIPLGPLWLAISLSNSTEGGSNEK